MSDDFEKIDKFMSEGNKSLSAHENKKAIVIKDFGAITITGCSIGDISEADKFSHNPESFTLTIFERTIDQPKLSFNDLQQMHKEQLEELGRKWLEFNSYYLEDFQKIESDNETKYLSFFEKFKLTIEAPEKRMMERLKPSIDKFFKANEKLIKSFPELHLEVPSLSTQKSIIEKLNASKKFSEKLAGMDLAKNLKNIPTLDLSRNYQNAIRSLMEMNKIQKNLPNMINQVENIDSASSPQFEMVRAVNKVEAVITKSMTASEHILETFTEAVEDQRDQSKENLQVQNQIKNLTIWLVVLTTVIILDALLRRFNI